MVVVEERPPLHYRFLHLEELTGGTHYRKRILHRCETRNEAPDAEHRDIDSGSYLLQFEGAEFLFFTKTIVIFTAQFS